MSDRIPGKAPQATVESCDEADGRGIIISDSREFTGFLPTHANLTDRSPFPKNSGVTPPVPSTVNRATPRLAQGWFL
jgi:hypothetical protein